MSLITAEVLVRPALEQWLFQAANPMERVSALNVWDYGPQSSPYRQFPDIVRLADVLVPACKAGDILQASCNFEITNDLNYAVELASKLVMTQSPTALAGLSLTGAGGTGYNISPEMHHGDQHMIGFGVVPADGDWYIAAIVYAGGSSFSQAGDTVKVEVGYGDLDVLRARGAYL